jgi:hypothetical protein
VTRASLVLCFQSCAIFCKSPREVSVACDEGGEGGRDMSAGGRAGDQQVFVVVASIMEQEVAREV